MARPLRIEFPGALYHITTRGKMGQEVYIDDQDRTHFLALLAREISQQNWLCHAYCLMPNYYQLLLETPQPNLVSGMRRFNGAYSQHFNLRHGRTGPLFHGRYRSVVVDKQNYLLEIARYVVLTPVRKRLVTHAKDWVWSSYRASAGIEAKPAWLSLDWMRQLGYPRPRAIAAYQAFMEEGIKAPSPWKNRRQQVWLGSAEFAESMQRKLRGQSRLSAIPGTQIPSNRPDLRIVVQDVAAAYKIDPDTLFTRVHQAAFQACVYLLRRVSNMPLRNVADIAGVSPSRISHIQRKLENNKTDAVLQQLLQHYGVTNVATTQQDEGANRHNSE